jgi:hypothetical protein
MDWLLIVIGVFLLLVAAVLESYCEFSRQAAPQYRPKIFETRVGILFWIGWIVLLLAGGILLLLADRWWALGAIMVYWLLLPLWLMTAMRDRMLPPWEMVKEELESQGYTEKNYTRGDWWKKKKEPKEPATKEARIKALFRKSPSSGRSYYRILYVAKGATQDEIDQAYQKLATRYHPDRNPGREQWASEKMAEINEAYGVIGDAEKRKEYDKKSLK